MEEKSLKDQAAQIISQVDRELNKTISSGSTVPEEDAKVNKVMESIFNTISDVDLQAAAARVEALKQKHHEASTQELAQKLIREKCQRTGTIGAVTSGAGLIPGIGTAAAVTLGVAADIGATFKLQAELVLELAALYDYPLSEQEKQRVVLFITGISAGTTAAARRAGQTATIKLTEKFAERSILKALPVIGVVASAGTNVLSTYIIGQRADAYFRLGPEAVGSWRDSLRTISGVDEREVGKWMAESSQDTKTALIEGAGRVGEAAKSTGQVVSNRAGQLAGSAGTGLKSGATKVGAAVSFIPRKVFGWFGNEKKNDDEEDSTT